MSTNSLNNNNSSNSIDKPITTKEKKLSKRDELFCLAYVNNLCNAKKAYLEVYPDCSVESARRLGQRKMTNDLVRAYIDQLQAEIKAQYKVSLPQVMQEQIDNYERMKKGTRKVIFSTTGESYEYTEYNDRAINEALMNITKMAGLDKPQPQELNVKVGPDPVHLEILNALKDVKIEGVDDVDGNAETSTDSSSST